MAAFSRYIGIDYSGAETPESSLKGLRVYCAKSRRSETLEIALICRCKRYKLHENQDHSSMSRSGPPPSPKGLGLGVTSPTAAEQRRHCAPRTTPRSFI